MIAIAGIAEKMSAPGTYAAMQERVERYLKEQAAGKSSRLAGLKTELAELEARIGQNDDRLKKLYLPKHQGQRFWLALGRL
jgi:hypothetical protein